MFWGIIAGLIAALGQSCSYIFSRHFVVRFGNPLHLMIYSQIFMGIFSLLLFPWVVTPGTFKTSTFIGPLLMSSMFYLMGQGCFFVAIREVEASRLSSLLGLKLLVLALISIIFMHVGISAVQWLAIVMCVAAAMMMNWSGGRMTWRAAAWVCLCCIGYSLSDIGVRELVLCVDGETFAQKALTGTVLCYLFLGIIATPMLFFIKRSGRAFLTALPVAICWYVAMLFLFACFGMIGTVFGNIIQSSRGLISVLLGIMLVKMEMAHLESKASKKVMVRRISAALLMFAAIVIYAYSRK